MYSLLVLVLLLLCHTATVCWLRMNFFPFFRLSLSRQFPTNAKRTRIPFFCIFLNERWPYHLCSAHTFQFDFAIYTREKQNNKICNSMGFFRVLIGDREEEDEPKKKTSFFPLILHTLVYVMTFLILIQWRFIFFFVVCVRLCEFFHQRAHTDTHQRNDDVDTIALCFFFEIQ